ncbi:MAG: hypothetical protein JWN27_2934 [Candidatus Eremiobacteraeota bacterium]|nr:hypothetical protein [Candidatus Eremiobacteraeota bacterium]
MTRRIIVYGIAIPQGNKSAFVVNGRAVMREGRSSEAYERFKSWREAVASAARAWIAANGSPPPLDGPVVMWARFYLPRPKSLPKRITLPTSRPDAGKLGRNVEDALTGLIFTDDSRIVDSHIYKRYAIDTPPHAVIEIELATES